jgi:hypothetical protein
MNTFQRGAIYWSAATGAHAVYGGIWTKYSSLSGAPSVLGLPTSDEAAGPVPGSRVQHFQGGDIFWSAATGAHSVFGLFEARWLALGGATGSLGLPTSDVGDSAGGDLHQNFAGGVLYQAANGVQALFASPVPGLTVQQAADAIDRALADLRNMLTTRKAALQNWSPAEQALFQRWFGSTDAAARATILTRIDKELQLIQDTTLGNFQMPSPVDPTKYAYVYPDDSNHLIYLDPRWVSAPAVGTDSRAGTLAHEMSHFTDVGGTHDYAYGPTNCLSLALKDPGHALFNADSFEYYIEGV